MSDYPYPSYIRPTAVTNTVPSTHNHHPNVTVSINHHPSLPPQPQPQPQNMRSVQQRNPVMNSITPTDLYGTANSRIPYHHHQPQQQPQQQQQQPPINSHHHHNAVSFQLNPNAAPFHPTFSSYHQHHHQQQQPQPQQQQQQQEIPPYANAPMYDGYCPPNAYDYQFGQEQVPLFTPYMDPGATVIANGDDQENGGADLGYGNIYGYYGQQVTLSPALCERMMYNERAKELQEIQVGLEQLIAEPGEFETWSNAIRERTTNPSFKVDALKIAVEMIIQMAALTSTSQTVQYNLAKLCSLLCHDLSTFQDDMIDSLLFFHEKQRSNLADDQRKNLLLFFAEIYEKLEPKNSQKMRALEQALLEQIKEILLADHLNDAKVKVVVDVLKLTGRYLDTDEGSSKINELLTQLNAIAKAHPAISDCVKERILSLNTWRENKWDARNFPANKEEKQPVEQSRKENNEPGLTPSCSSSFIIGPDGQPLTEEERAFLEENFGKLDNSDVAMDNDDVSDEYDEFLSAIANEEAKKYVAEIEVAEMEKQLAKTNLNGLDRGTNDSAQENGPKRAAT